MPSHQLAVIGRPGRTGLQVFPRLSLGEMPAIETHVSTSAKAPPGLGEPPVPLAIPAVLIVVCAATGQLGGRLPLTADTCR